MLGGYKYKTRIEGICNAFDLVHEQKGVESFNKGRMCDERLAVYFYKSSVQKMVRNHYYYSYWIKMLAMTKGLGTLYSEEFLFDFLNECRRVTCML